MGYYTDPLNVAAAPGEACGLKTIEGLFPFGRQGACADFLGQCFVVKTRQAPNVLAMRENTLYAPPFQLHDRPGVFFQRQVSIADFLNFPAAGNGYGNAVPGDLLPMERGGGRHKVFK